MPNLYQNEASDPKLNAQRNLMGRTHFVDPETLSFHRSRVLATHVADGGLLFSIVTSDALDWENTKRGFRYTIFDLFGTVLERASLDEAYKTRAQAYKAMWTALNAIDAKGITLSAIARAEHYHAQEMAELRKRLVEMTVAA